MSVNEQPADHGRSDVLARIYDVALLDLDGVVYIGQGPVAHASDALERARAIGMRLAFVTNNASRGPAVVAAHLTELGVAASPEEVVTSAQAAARMLSERVPRGGNVLVVGGDGLVEALVERGLVPVWSAAERPAAVVQGFAPEVNWRALAEGAYAVAEGVPWVASNPDLTIPTQRGIAPGNGALVEVIKAATAREPLIAGKPEPPMHREAMLRTGARRPLVVGDRLDTDIQGASRAEADSLLVLTGVADAVDAVLAPPGMRPTYLGHDLRALNTPAHTLAVVRGQRQHGAWMAAVEDGRLRLTRSPGDRGADSALEAVRAACGAVWAAPDGVDPDSVRAALRESSAVS